MSEVLPYVVSIVCALIAMLSSIMISRKQIKGEIEKLIKQHELDLETEREKHKNELEKSELEHRHQLELIQKETENRMGEGVVNTFISEVIKTPEIRSQISKGFMQSGKKRKYKQ